MTHIDCLVIGASGPIGQSVLARFEETGHSALGVSRSLPNQVDISDPVQAQQLFTRLMPHTVIYLATPAPQSLEQDADLVQQSISTAERTAALAAETGVKRFVYCSSSAVYGTATHEPITEDHPLLGTGGYAASKIDSEAAVIQTLSATSTTPLLLRVFNVYGPGCSQSLINRLANPEVTIWDTDRFVRDYIHVDDVARALQAATEYEGTATVFNIGTGLGTSNHQLVELVSNWREVRTSRYHGPDSFSVAATERAQRELRFRAVFDVSTQLATGTLPHRSPTE